ncbi:hypothetical protein GOODEAATRI_034275 [Goodea atripinnis]|uniref:Uncharacterized protein n=1 Tax=Goodea atripinnis TaxID=208336 RepID=A0ABV0N0J9_9TELE
MGRGGADAYLQRPWARGGVQPGQVATHPFTPKGNLERPVNLTVMFVDCGRRLKYPERTHRCATNCAIVQPVLKPMNESTMWNKQNNAGFLWICYTVVNRQLTGC